MLFVLGQFSGITAIVITGPWLVKHPFFLVLELLGVLIGLWAIFTMRKSRLRIVPEVHKEAQLVTEGPYQWVVHPMYTAVLITTLAMVLDFPTLSRGLYWVALLIILLFKLRYEESQLVQKFGKDFTQYILDRKKIIPFIY